MTEAFNLKNEYGCFRTRITLESASASNWQSDTIAGYLVHTLALIEEESAVKDFRDECNSGRPPFVVSNGFPPGCLPLPFMPLPPIAPNLGKQERISRRLEIERWKDVRYVDTATFSRVISGASLETIPFKEDISGGDSAWDGRVTWKNTINRATGTTLEEGAGGLFDFAEIISKEVDIYFLIRNDYPAHLRKLLDTMKEEGYGKRRTAGYGQIKEIGPLEICDLFSKVENPDGFVSLSNFIPAATDPTHGFWHTLVKYGKIGEGISTDKPFKKPLVMLEAGSCFLYSPVRPFYGRIVAGINKSHPEVFQFGYALGVPMRFPDHVLQILR